MIIIMKPSASEENIRNVAGQIEEKGLTVHLSHGTEVTIIGVVGDKSKLQGSNLEIADGVDKVVACLLYTSFSGIRTVKVVPSPSLLCSLIAPWCISTMLLVIASPRPVPPVSLDRALSTR